MEWTSHLPPSCLPLSAVVSTLWIVAICRDLYFERSLRDRSTRTKQWCLRTYFVIPTAIIALLSSVGTLCSIARRWRVSPFPGNPIHDYRSVPYLPEEEDNVGAGAGTRNRVSAELLKRIQRNNEGSPLGRKDVSRGCVLITGASRGIGRALAVEFARRYAPSKCLILAARTVPSLRLVADDLAQHYGANVTVVQSDLSKRGQAQALFLDTSKKMKLFVDVLVLNAGAGHNRDVVGLQTHEVEDIVRLNAESASILAGLYGNEMVRRFAAARKQVSSDGEGGGRIVIVSSLTGAGPGVPGAAVYAATKAYLRSFSWSLSAELEPSGIPVTCALPGATATSFASRSGINEAVVWHYPLTVAWNVSQVARRIVDAVIRGDIEVFPGRFLDEIFIRVFMPLAPPWFVTWFMGFSWRRWPLRFPLGWTKDTIAVTDAANEL